MSVFGRGIERVCGVVAASSAREMARQIKLVLRETPTVELRLDWLANDAERGRLLRWLAKNRPRHATFLATCRSKAGGGLFHGGVAAELQWLVRAHQAGCSWCDLEVETLAKLPGKSIPKDLALPRILLSVHDFQGTRRQGFSTGLARPIGVHAIKIAANVQRIADSVRLLRIVRQKKNCVVVPMGEAGLPARILALREGSALAYAPISQATAPGQVSLQELKRLYRAHELTRRTQVFGVIGNPIRHSLSPLLHNTGFISQKADAVYLPFLVKDLRDFLKAVPDFGIRGFSVTLPHKQAILKYLDECDALAADVGAVNTVVVRRNGSLYGCNTDYAGVLGPLKRKLRLAGSRILILGAGGSARAAAFALTREGAQVGICARRKGAARELARASGAQVISRDALRHEFFEAVLNATPVGIYPQDGISPLEPGELHCRIVMDFIYRPERTQLLKLASRKGIATVPGVEMFLAQGAAQWEIWMKRRAPEAAMRRAILGALRNEKSSPAPPRGPR